MRTDAHLPVSRNRFDRLTLAERFHDESARNREIKRSRYAVPDYSACQGESCLAASRIRTASRKGHVVDRRQWRVAPFEIRSARRKLNRLNVDRARREQIQAPVVVMDFMYRTSYGGVCKISDVLDGATCDGCRGRNTNELGADLNATVIPSRKSFGLILEVVGVSDTPARRSSFRRQTYQGTSQMPPEALPVGDDSSMAPVFRPTGPRQTVPVRYRIRRVRQHEALTAESSSCEPHKKWQVSS